MQLLQCARACVARLLTQALRLLCSQTAVVTDNDEWRERRGTGGGLFFQSFPFSLLFQSPSWDTNLSTDICQILCVQCDCCR